MVRMIPSMLKCTLLCNYSTALPVAKPWSAESTSGWGCKLWVGRSRAHWVSTKREGRKDRTSSLNFHLMSPPETQTLLQTSSFGSLQKQRSNPLFKLKFIASTVIPAVCTKHLTVWCGNTHFYRTTLLEENPLIQFATFSTFGAKQHLNILTKVKHKSNNS